MTDIMREHLEARKAEDARQAEEAARLMQEKLAAAEEAALEQDKKDARAAFGHLTDTQFETKWRDELKPPLVLKRNQERRQQAQADTLRRVRSVFSG